MKLREELHIGIDENGNEFRETIMYVDFDAPPDPIEEKINTRN